jgi:hypothetical protein
MLNCTPALDCCARLEKVCTAEPPLLQHTPQGVAAPARGTNAPQAHLAATAWRARRLPAPSAQFATAPVRIWLNILTQLLEWTSDMRCSLHAAHAVTPLHVLERTVRYSESMSDD